jgi:hypothetical protein
MHRIGIDIGQRLGTSRGEEEDAPLAGDGG